ncbi:helix-turn-helix domain-containing protein [Hyalangium rubrum]|uniref:Helix-turn-helix domain-containing protein n=1 Tax=Hyalangium rubrum TaxID=3103134 RepID=A0ABU5GZ33_9BACT|nr:helix-turn-helix domain-containing protein [Hyalangium sp. s54d21]MDY7225778.1 helix-turn-helix domain-containing protein [Hyalangium sp. s54d21]
MDADERAVEVNRLLLARLREGASSLVIPTLTVATVPTRRQRKAGAELLSKKAAAHLLGVDRATTLEKFIATGQIKTVEIDGRVRIPREEVERVINEGLPTAGPQRSKTRRASKASTFSHSESPGAEIRKLKF